MRPRLTWAVVIGINEYAKWPKAKADSVIEMVKILDKAPKTVCGDDGGCHCRQDKRISRRLTFAKTKSEIRDAPTDRHVN